MLASSNHDQLLAVALDLFAARGYDAVGVQAIVQQAGVTKPTLYHYFGSKQGLLEALLEQHHAKLYSRLKEATYYSDALPLVLNRTATTYLTFAQRHPLFCRFQLALLFLPPEHEVAPVASRFFRQYSALLEELFIKAAHDHGNMRGRHEQYAWTFLGMINSYITLMMNGQVQMGEQLSRELVHQFSHGIYS